MLMSTLALGLTLTAQSQSPRPEIISASLFKNGYAMVTRSIKVKGGTVVLDSIPNPALGTFWVTSDGPKIREMVVSMEESETQTPVSSFRDFLLANVGSKVEVTTVNLGKILGTIKSVVGDTVMLDQGNSQVMLPLGEVRLLQIGNSKTNQSVKTLKRVLRIKTDSDGTLFLYGLERGMSWVPGYMVNMIDDKTLQIAGKATVLNDLDSFTNADLRFVTGFPNVPFAAMQEPFLSGQSLDQYLGFLTSIGSAGPGGGLSGRRELGSQMVMNQALSMDAMEAFVPQVGTGEQLEDLFFYKLSALTLPKQGRGMYMLFEFKTPFEHKYECELPLSGAVSERYVAPDENPPEVWHSLEFKNSAAQPLTTGVATVYKKNEMIGQDTLKYTTTGGMTTLKINKALDVRVESQESEIERLPRAFEVPRSSVIYDLLTLQGTVSAANRKGDAITLKVTKTVVGEIEKAEGNPKITKVAKGLRDTNPISKLEWNIPIKSGEKASLTYTYKTYIRSN